MFEEKRLKNHLQELAGACYCIAAASHGMSEEEVRLIAENISVFAERKVASAEVAKLVSKARADCEVHGGVYPYLKVLASRIPDAQAKTELLGAAATVVLADHQITWEEQKVFDELATVLGLSDHESKFILRSVAAPLRDAAAATDKPNSAD